VPSTVAAATGATAARSAVLGVPAERQHNELLGVAVCGMSGGRRRYTDCVALPTTNPSVTYKYRTDQELLTASQNATTYCGQYQTAPRAATITNNADGSKTAVFQLR
jgi:hypothetical protein